jgi:hypothetical protein
MAESVKKIKPPKALSVAGVNEAIELVEELAFMFAYEDLLASIAQGAFGRKMKTMVKDNYGLLLESYEVDKPLANAKLDAALDCLADLEADWLERLAVPAGPMIAKLWDLSESAGTSLAKWIYWRTSLAEQYKIVFDNGKKNNRLDNGECKATVSTQIQKNRIYLDVTDLSFTDLHKSYRYISTLRKIIGIHTQEMREGAPNSIDARKALDIYADKCDGVPTKEIAKKYGFKIYTGDNPSGSYPLLRRYLKIGKDLDEKLTLLNTQIPTFNVEVQQMKQRLQSAF